MPSGRTRKGPRNSRPPRPRALAQRRLRPGLPPTVALRVPAAATAIAKAVAPPPAPSPVEPPAAVMPVLPVPVPTRTSRNGLVLRGGFWEIRYDGGSAIVADSRGMRYIALLIAQAAREARPVHARELVALADGQAPAPIELDAKVEVLDATARQQLAKRLEDLAAERDRACAAEQFEKAAALDEEFERIAIELRHAEGSGRRATFSSAGERARKAVGKAIAE